MTLKRGRNTTAAEVVQNEAKKIKYEDQFYNDLVTSDQDDTESKKPKKIKKPKLPQPEWVAGGGHLLQKYIKFKELIDIESLIQDYLKENKVEVIEGIIADKKSEQFHNEANLKIKSSEVLRLERLKNSNANTIKKTEEQQNLEDYFKDALQIEMMTTFSAMHLEKRLMKAIAALGYTTPTPIQAATIPVVLAGKDVCGCAATGTGKTAAYMLPTLDRLLCAGRPAVPVTRVLVIVPTRELGVQVFQVCQSLVKFSSLKIGLVAGGLNYKMQERELLKKPDVVIATPGTLLKYIKNLEGFTLENVEVLILDEADRILDDYFDEQMSDVIHRCSPHRQTLLFSATMTTEVKRIATAALTEPVKVFINSNTHVAQGLRQEYVLLKDGANSTRNATLVFLLMHVFNNNTIVFLPTKLLCHRLYVVMRLCGLKVGELHSKLPQSARLANLASFAKGNIRVLLATDLAARGLDIKGVDNVINYKLNSSYEMYVHRVGRTARAGKEGLALSMVPDKEYKSLKLIKKMSKTIMYERKIDKSQVKEWKIKMTILDQVCDKILAMEKEALKEEAETELKGQINHLVAKNKRKQDHQQKLSENAKEKSHAKMAAQAEGLTVKEYLRNKRLDSKSVSNSKKKRVLRFKERQHNPLFRTSKKAIKAIETPPTIPMHFPKRKKNKNKVKETAE